MQSPNEIEVTGMLYVVGIGPGDPESMTFKARRAIDESEYVIGNSTYIDQIKDIIGGQEVIRSRMGEEVKRAVAAVDLAKDHKVSMISGGDANVYGMAGLVMEVAESKSYGGRIEVIPGITALTAAASLLGAPIVNDFVVISLSDLLTPWEVIKKRLECAAVGDFVIALYNPKSRRRNKNFSEAMELIKQYRKEKTPVGIVKNVSRPNESVSVTTLEKIDEHEDEIDMATTVLIGNSESRIWHSSSGIDRIITPRGYQRKYEY